MKNNEKKTIKVSFNTFLVIVISLVIVGFMGVSIYAKSLGKPNIISAIQALMKSEKKENTDEVKGDQKQNIDLDNSNNELDNETAKQIFEKGASKIRKLQYEELIKTEYEISGNFIEKEINGKTYVKTNEKYETVKQKYGELFTDKALENVLAKRFANVDGILYVSYGGATGWDITNVEVEKINEKDGELTYKASYNNMGIDGSVGNKKQTCEFKLKKVDEEYKISETNYCNLGQEENTNQNNNNNELDNETAKQIFEKGASKIRKLQYEELIKTEYEISGNFIEKEINGKTYVKTNEKYETVKQKYGELFTDKALENVLAKRFANVDGILYVSYGGATGWDITNVEVEKINEKDGELTYKASYNNMGIDGSVDNKEQTCEFKIKKVNEEYKISETNYCNLDKK